jgi:hypothetical protein
LEKVTILDPIFEQDEGVMSPPPTSGDERSTTSVSVSTREDRVVRA